MAWKNKDNSNVLKGLCLSIAVIGFAFSLCFLFFSLIDLRFLILSVLCAIVFVVFYMLARGIYKGYKIKYLWLGKKFKVQFQEALKKFNTTDEEFIERFKRSAKINYKRCGSVLGEVASSSWVYRSDEHIPMLKEVFSALDDCVKSRGGFVEFIETLNKKGQSSYELHPYVFLDVLSKELYYLLEDVFHYSNFCLTDIGLSERFEEENNAMKKRLNDVYSKILFEFEDEIDELAKKVAGLKEIEKLKVKK